jgi:hypothetical protein
MKFFPFCGIAIPIIVCSCSTQPTKTMISKIDLTSKNFERIREGLEYALGSDSAGSVSMNYITEYEAQIQKLYPADKNVVVKPEPIISNWDWIPPRIEPEQVKDNPSLRIFLNYLQQEKLHSILLLNKSYDAYTSTKNLGDAKMGVAAGYVALTLNPSAGEMQSLTDKMYSLLNELYSKYSTPH